MVGLLNIILFLVGCGQSRSSESDFFESGSREATAVALEKAPSSGGGSGSFPDAHYLLAATSEALNDLEFCMGPAADCRAGQGQLVRATAAGQVNGRFLFRSESPVVLQANLIVHLTTGRVTLGAPRILRVIRIVAAGSLPPTGNPTGSLIPTLPPGQAGELKLTFGAVFNQKNTNWCWGYSAYHTLRTYYDTIPVGADPVADQWRAALSTLNTNQNFWDFMESTTPQSQLGSPHQFVELMRRHKGMPAHKKWSYASQNSRQQAIKNVEANLRLGIPSSYCRSGHCVMIYGFKTDGAAATEFLIADSVGSRFYTEAANRVAERYTALWSQPRESTTYTRAGDQAATVSPDEPAYESDAYYDRFPASTGSREP